MLNNSFYVIMATDENYGFDWYAGHDYRAHSTGLPTIKCDLRTCDHYQTYKAAISAWKKNRQYLRDETLSNYRISKIIIKETVQANLDVIDNMEPLKTQSFIQLDMEYYIRFGEIPEDGFSKIHRGDAIMGLEPGVFVYDCCQRRGKWMICVPNPIHPFTADTLKDFVTDIIESTNRKIYLVTGTYVGVGSDGEPCLSNVQIIKDITSEFQIDQREYSFMPKGWITKKYLPTQEQIIRGLTPEEVDKEIARGNSLAISFSPF